MYENSSSLHLHEFLSHAVISGRHPINYRFTLSITDVISLIGIIVGIKVYSKSQEMSDPFSLQENSHYHSAKITYHKKTSYIKLHI